MHQIRVSFGFEINAHVRCDIFRALPKTAVAFAQLMRIEGDAVGWQRGTKFAVARREAALGRLEYVCKTSPSGRWCVRFLIAASQGIANLIWRQEIRHPDPEYAISYGILEPVIRLA